MTSTGIIWKKVAAKAQAAGAMVQRLSTDLGMPYFSCLRSWRLLLFLDILLLYWIYALFNAIVRFKVLKIHMAISQFGKNKHRCDFGKYSMTCSMTLRMYTRTLANVSEYTYTHSNGETQTCTNACPYACTHTYYIYKYRYKCKYTHTSAYVYIYMYIHTYKHTFVHNYIHT